ncbi:uncharacterized protein ACA1_184750 [Acanthamoeba castellanii str. Neff]|uniref:Uncharacterized protein n=1 Tax=Acanthamoeba castellanii (strain ATCC 30010 / Neff) TaxID=1257118 RepID=L8H510_ACACF|nr:uncharacterized protein ACA1_184750 [Acanthamoeba castellanii str. Neff]ELR20322.1 hypothetical protein ACA1_184750 [Acanthamoeba castellanii str. Neff]
MNIEIRISNQPQASLANLSPCIQMLLNYFEVKVGPLRGDMAPIFDMDFTDDTKALVCLQQRCLLGLLHSTTKSDSTKTTNVLAVYVVSAGMLNLNVNNQSLSSFANHKSAAKLQDSIRALCNLANISPATYPGVRKMLQSFSLLTDVSTVQYEKTDMFASLW